MEGSAKASWGNEEGRGIRQAERQLRWRRVDRAHLEGGHVRRPGDKREDAAFKE